MNKHLKLVLKLAVAAALLYMLMASDKLDFRKLSIFIDEPKYLAANFFLYAIFIVLGAIRWHILMSGLNIHLPLMKTIQLQMIGMFFNTTMPGSVGGDLIKAVYVMKENDGRKTRALLSIFIDRVCGVMGLFILATLAMTMNTEAVFGNPTLASLGFIVIFAAIGICVVFVILKLPYKEDTDPILKIINNNRVLKKLETIYIAICSYRQKPEKLFYALMIGGIVQGSYMVYFAYITEALTGVFPDIFLFATIFPFGMIMTSLPLAPAGMGVGHYAFEALYRTMSLSGGADVFNVIQIAILATGVLGIVPYLMYKAHIPDIRALQDEK